VQGSQVAPRAIVMQTKTRRPVQFDITEQTRDAIAAWITDAHLKSEQFLFRLASSRRDRRYFFGGAAGSIEAGGPSEFQVSRTYSHFPPFFLETERYFPASITRPALSFTT